jgi:hypothetical protein
MSKNNGTVPDVRAYAKIGEENHTDEYSSEDSLEFYEQPPGCAEVIDFSMLKGASRLRDSCWLADDAAALRELIFSSRGRAWCPLMDHSIGNCRTFNSNIGDVWTSVRIYLMLAAS